MSCSKSASNGKYLRKVSPGNGKAMKLQRFVNETRRVLRRPCSAITGSTEQSIGYVTRTYKFSVLQVITEQGRSTLEEIKVCWENLLHCSLISLLLARMDRCLWRLRSQLHSFVVRRNSALTFTLCRKLIRVDIFRGAIRKNEIREFGKKCLISKRKIKRSLMLWKCSFTSLWRISLRDIYIYCWNKKKCYRNIMYTQMYVD